MKLCMNTKYVNYLNMKCIRFVCKQNFSFQVSVKLYFELAPSFVKNVFLLTADQFLFPVCDSRSVLCFLSYNRFYNSLNPL